MPFLRFTRDKRGYENTYVMHVFRGRGRGESRILYWFRTPPNVRVGRAALDEEAIRTIEERHPDLSFDWTRMLKAKDAPPAPPPPDRDARRRGREGAPPGRRPRTPTPWRPATGAMEPEAPDAGPAAGDTRPSTPAEEGSATEVVPGVTEEVAAAETGGGAAGPDEVAVHPVEALVGPEGLARCRARHAELLARISERIGDPARRDALRAEAEALDPDTWVTETDARAALATFDEALEAMRRRLGRRRRRSRRGGRRRTGGDRGPRTAGAAGQPEQAGEARSPGGPRDEAPPAPEDPAEDLED